jgi:hypothetical protein
MNENGALFPSYEEIKALAANIAQWKDTYDDLIWLMAEAELKVRTGVKPTHEQIKAYAEEIAQKHPPLHELHWFLAERYLYLVKKEQSEA